MHWSTKSSQRPVWIAGVVAMLLNFALAGCAPPPIGTSPAPEPVATTPDRILELTVNFGFNSHMIPPDSYQLLDNVARGMSDRRLAGYHFDVNGHTDITGRLGYNLALSVLRAQAVVDYLSARGVPREVMRVQGFGPLQLLNPANPAGAENRRVEIVSIR